MREPLEVSASVKDSPASGPYGTSAMLYSENGWHPLPVFDHGKGKVPAGFTGYHARKVTGDDITRWIDDQDLGDSNICLRLMYEVGIDIDSHDDTKQARKAWEHLCRLHREPPPTVRISSRFGDDYDGLAGIKLYRLPRKYRHLVEQQVWQGQAGSGIDVIRLGHRQVVVWPSLHPSRGTRYQWLDERTGEIHDGPLPSPESLPELPDAWVEQVLLKQTPEKGGGHLPAQDVARSLSGSAHWTDGEPCAAVRTALTLALSQLQDGRHDGALKHMTALTRLGEQGHRGVLKAIGTLKAEFLHSTSSEQRDSRGEWERMVTGVDSVIEANGLTSEAAKGCCGDASKRKPKAADLVLELAEELFLTGRTIDDRPFIVPRTGPNAALFSGRARAALAEAFLDRHNTTVNDKSLREAWTVVERRALSSEPVDLPIRVADHDGGVVIDLGTADGRCAIADPTGWRIEARSPVVFRRPKPLLPLRDPQRGGDWRAFWQLTNITDAHQDLVRGWLACSIMRFVPHPILRIKGPQGAAKSTATKILSRIVDPSSGDAAKPPTTPDRWEMTVGSRWIVPVDNVSLISEWWADDLCRTVTGAATIDRELYTDDDVVVKRLRGAVILNGITMPGELRPDLLERTVSVEVARPAIYLSERDVEAQVVAILPSVLGLILTDIVAVLRNTGRPQAVRDLRMQDFATVLSRLDAVKGTHALAQYRANLDGLAADALESDPVATRLVSLMRNKKEWTGTATELLRELTQARYGDLPERWPKDARRLSEWLMRATTTLFHVGLEVQRLPRSKTSRQLRIIRK